MELLHFIFATPYHFACTVVLVWGLGEALADIARGIRGVRSRLRRARTRRAHGGRTGEGA